MNNGVIAMVISVTFHLERTTNANPIRTTQAATHIVSLTIASRNFSNKEYLQKSVPKKNDG